MAQFDREGYVVKRGLFSDADLQPVIDEITAEIDARAAELVEAGELSSSFAECDFETRLSRISRETDKVAVGIWNGALCGPAFFHLITHPRMLDVAEQICGPELIASSVYRLRPKLPDHPMSAVPWHQDSGYFEPYCDSALVLTVWIPLVDVDADNGCMWVLPGQHNGAVLEHRRASGHPYLEIPPTILPPDSPLCVPMRKGSALLMTNRTPHASFENRTEHVRWSMDLRYQGAALPTNASISRVPGEALPDPERGVPVACYPPEADFLVSSRTRPNEVVTSPEEFRRIRTQHVHVPVTNRFATPPAAAAASAPE
jgi:phytanoyl-CoA hydroxylase